MKRPLPILLALLLVAALAALFLHVQRHDPGRASLIRHANELGDISIRFGQSQVISRLAGKPEWALTANRVDFRHNTGGPLESFRAVELQGIANGQLFRNGHLEATFDARSAVFDRGPQRLDVSGGIHVRTPAGDVLNAQALTWSVQDEFARFPGGASGKVHGHPITAPVLLFAPNKRILQCPGGASVLLPGGMLTADSLFWDVGRGVVHCPGTARWARNSGDITGQDVLLELNTRSIHVKKATVRIPIDEVERSAEVQP